MNMSENKMVRLLPAHLKGTAKAVFEVFEDDEKQNWPKATTMLKKHFSTDHFLNIARETLMEMKMKENESPVMFSNRIKKDILDAYPHVQFTEKRRFLQTMIFTNGLSTDIKQKLKLLGPLASDHSQLVRDAERMWDLTTSYSEATDNRTLMRKVDRILDKLDPGMAPINMIVRPNQFRSPRYRPTSYFPCSPHFRRSSNSHSPGRRFNRSQFPYNPRRFNLPQFSQNQGRYNRPRFPQNQSRLLYQQEKSL